MKYVHCSSYEYISKSKRDHSRFYATSVIKNRPFSEINKEKEKNITSTSHHYSNLKPTFATRLTKSFTSSCEQIENYYRPQQVRFQFSIITSFNIKISTFSDIFMYFIHNFITKNKNSFQIIKILNNEISVKRKLKSLPRAQQAFVIVTR